MTIYDYLRKLGDTDVQELMIFVLHFPSTQTTQRLRTIPERTKYPTHFPYSKFPSLSSDVFAHALSGTMMPVFDNYFLRV